MSKPRLSLQRSGLAALPLLAVLAIGACKREPAELAGAASEPAAAVRQLAHHVRANDLVGFARAAVPPAQYAQLEIAWRENRSRWPLTELPLEDKLAPMLAVLAAKDSERRLGRQFDSQFARQDRDLKAAARSLGLFGVQYVKNEGNYTTEERDHYAQIIRALGEWAEEAPLGDPQHADVTITRLAAAARKTGLTSEQDLAAAGMEGSLRRLSPFFAEAKAVLDNYGLPLDASLADLRTGLVEQKGDKATVRIHYPLAGQEIDTVASLELRDGHWYLSDYLRHVEQVLAAPAPVIPAVAELPANPAPPAR
ncbi:hypothetical protein [Pseudoxanthomonas sp. UTMC 1351]|uniref:hypothetical protein n=1 Tax=Pseudoxanthomonas sp. UTMC 1351 TaxID=2695853 RepID=UPI0034CFDC2E